MIRERLETERRKKTVKMKFRDVSFFFSRSKFNINYSPLFETENDVRKNMKTSNLLDPTSTNKLTFRRSWQASPNVLVEPDIINAMGRNIVKIREENENKNYTEMH